MIDACAERGYLAATLHSQQIMQMVVQARWIEESPFLTLPFVESYNLNVFNEMSKALGQPCNFPIGLKSACLNKYEVLARHLRKEFDEGQIEQIYKVYNFYPKNTK